MTTEEIKTESKGFMETNENEYTHFHNSWDIAKAGIRGKYIAISVHKKKVGRWQKGKLTSYLRELGAGMEITNKENNARSK